MATKNNVKKRNWAFVLYPESAPSDWREQLQLTGLQCAVSPLHDKDVNPDGEPKKAHYHIIVCYSGPTSFNVVKGLTDKLNQPIPIALEQIRGYYRYLTHKDNPEKYQYSDNEITTINGFDVSDYIELTKSEVDVIKLELQKLIRDKHIVEYNVFMNYIQDFMDQEYYNVASSNTLFFCNYLKSLKFSNAYTVILGFKVGDYLIINTDTGEVALADIKN